MPDPTGGLIAGASVIGGASQASAARKGARAQEAAANRQIDLQERIYNETTERFAPYLGAGSNALAAYMYEMGLGPAPTMGGTAPQITEIPGSAANPAAGPVGAPQRGVHPDTGLPYQRVGETIGGPAASGTGARYQVGGRTFNTRQEAEAWAAANPTGRAQYQGFQKTPGYEFAFNEGMAGVNALASTRGGLVSGRTMQDLQKTGQGLAWQHHGQHLNRLAGLTDMGMGAAGNQAMAGNAFATGAGNAIGSIGNAQAAAATGVGNAWSDALTGGLSAWQYQQRLNKPRMGA
ncbi:hypothetical protein [Paracoccus siganidrum]|uniref:DNA transfer protein p32 n=1 Tax=Paracoccus siganidrum TaxID=1276757 RepID=A0A419A859_9RHOB|nr:hypothetical protein [Paracoccus siganidrum]RJL17991.1 hypothetical protein D3P05_08440 [Paracoccus siganidrum]RMC40979.1 hypothetical protein C9E82_00085 [Paracoccus siganidrum]